MMIRSGFKASMASKSTCCTPPTLGLFLNCCRYFGKFLAGTPTTLSFNFKASKVSKIPRSKIATLEGFLGFYFLLDYPSLKNYHPHRSY